MKKILSKVISFFTLKRIFKFFISLIVCLCIFCIFVHYSLTHILQSNHVKDRIISFANEQMNLELDFDRISAILFYFSLNDAEVKIKGDSKDFVFIKEITLYFAPLRLLFGKIHIFRISILKPQITISKNQKEKFNFEKILEAPLFTETEEKPEEPKKEQEDDDVLNLMCKLIQIRDLEFIYIDDKENISAKIFNSNIDISNISLANPFNIKSDIHISADVNDTLNIPEIIITIDSVCNLNNLQLQDAVIDINKFFIKTDKASITTSGKINNFSNPNIYLNIKIKDLSSDTVKYIMKDKSFSITEFNIPLISLQSKIKTNLEKENINIEIFSAEMLSSVIDITGFLNYSKMIYDFNISSDFILDKLTEITDIIKDFQPKGNIKTNIHLTNDNVDGTINLIQIGAFLEQAGILTDINSTIDIKSLSDISSKQITGKLNDDPFSVNFYYTLKNKVMDITTNFKSDKINIKSSQKKENKKQETKIKDTKEYKSKSSSFPEWLQTINIKANSDIKQLNSSMFSGSDISLKINLSDITPKLDKTHGNIALFTEKGTIKNLYELSDSNALMKVMFTSLVVVSKVINTLNVLDVLKSIGSVVASNSDEKNNNTETEQNEEHEQINGKLDYEKFETAINFVKGVANFQNCSFLSNVFSFKVGGNINFIDETLQMKVNAAPGKQYSNDGIMPLTIKISGTISEPNGNLSLLGSVTSLLTQSLFNNLASNFLKKSVSGLMNLGSQDGIATVDEDNTGQDTTKDKTVFIE